LTQLAPELRCYPDEKTLGRAAADEVVALAADAIQRRGRFWVALAGGSTPRPLYELLGGDPYRSRIRWSNVELFWSDERAVEPEHPASNFRMAREALLDRLDLRADQIHRMPGERKDLDAAACDHQAELARVAGISADGAPPRLDLVLLGMGSDAHTASLFPHTTGLSAGERWVVHNRAPVEPTDRLTLTFRTLNAARCLLLLIAGPSKAAPLAEVLEGERDPERLPCQSLAPAAGRMLWLIDQAAASRLTGSVPRTAEVKG
jgi:6-phosphogluconolactonase